MTNPHLIDTIGVAFACWAIAEGFGPLQTLKQYLELDGDKTWGPVVDVLIYIINCSLCLSFWTALYLFEFDLTAASVTAILGEAISRIEKNTKQI